MSYSAIEMAIRNQVLTHFSTELTSELCVISESDTLLEAVFRTGATYGCLIDLGIPPGRRLMDAPYNGRIWAWEIVGIFMVRFTGISEIETNARNVIDKLATLFASDPRLGGECDQVRLVTIDTPEPTEVNDIPFYFIMFVMEAWEK